MAAPWISDNCSNDVHYTVTVPTGTVIGDETTGYIILDLELGDHLAIIEASDCCGNTTIHRMIITVEDQIPPVAVCDAHTVVSLTSGVIPGTNYSKVYASTFDDGSHDNCNDVWFKVIRMDALLGTAHGSLAHNDVACDGFDGDDDTFVVGNQVFFDDFLKFCCADVDQTIMVVFRVFDVEVEDGPVAPYKMDGGKLSGHFTDCMVEVEVQDKTVPNVVAPPDVVVSCMFWFDDSEQALTNLTSSVFGRMVKNINNRQKVVTHDKVCEYYCVENRSTGYNPSAVQNGLACRYYEDLYDDAHPDDRYDLVWGFDGYAIGSCDLECSIRIDDRRECGQGPIYRYFTATRNGQQFTDVQVIWVVDCDPFEIGEECEDPDDDIIWPLNCQQPRRLDGCGANVSPDNPLLGRPEVVNNGDDNCALIAIEHFDDIFTIEPDACFKIIRTWIVIDWCQYNPLDPRTDGRWEYQQVIKVIDTNDPVVEAVIGDCEPAERDSNEICNGHLELTVLAEDECTPSNWLRYEYKIDLDDDGDYDLNVGPAKPGDAAQVSNNPYADDPKDATNASGSYPYGWHRITWYVEDGCGNIGTVDTVFHVLDCKAPTPYCLSGIITVVMPSTGSITIWASDLNIGSFDNCTEPEDLKYYFNGDTSRTGYVVSCDTFDAHGAIGLVRIEVEMWVEDEEGNTDFCRTTIEVQDPNGVCEGTNPLRGSIAGTIVTEDDRQVQDVRVELYNNGNMIIAEMTSESGLFAFNDLVRELDYLVDPIKTDNPANGVSTKDLVVIQRHLLDIDQMTSPYKLVAADANNSRSVSASDIAALRKLILGKTTGFSKVDSWRFIPKNFNFEDPSDPWALPGFPENMEYKNLGGHMTNSDFVAVKVR